MNETGPLNISTPSATSVTNEAWVIVPSAPILPISDPVVQQPTWSSPSMEIQKVLYNQNEQENLLASGTQSENITHPLNNGKPMTPVIEEGSESVCLDQCLVNCIGACFDSCCDMCIDNCCDNCLNSCCDNCCDNCCDD
ncbi:unnamed protein product [Diabrotica balteata]|uniref:Uncharacterized protein n=1 Tax=Diabrotica balteata TaxID=107213 RepID=A0A9N9XEF1_DIABA|nr:unnamed protein product [Diabrotica balteata]